jgi:hypothetical protein
MDVNLEIKPLKWNGSQGSLYYNDIWILVYELFEIPYQSGKHNAVCLLLGGSVCELNEKYKLKSSRDQAMNYEACFETHEKVVNACNSHYRELMLKVFLQVV